jgi:hypothetical protein
MPSKRVTAPAPAEVAPAATITKASAPKRTWSLIKVTDASSSELHALLQESWNPVTSPNAANAAKKFFNSYARSHKIAEPTTSAVLMVRDTNSLFTASVKVVRSKLASPIVKTVGEKQFSQDFTTTAEAVSK